MSNLGNKHAGNLVDLEEKLNWVCDYNTTDYKVSLRLIFAQSLCLNLKQF